MKPETGSVICCWHCQGVGFVPARFNDELDERRCSVVGCENGVIHFPLTSQAALDDAEDGMLTDGWLCVSQYTEGVCDHCRDLAAAEYSWMANYPRPTRAEILDAYEPGDPKRRAFDDLEW